MAGARAATYCTVQNTLVPAGQLRTMTAEGQGKAAGRSPSALVELSAVNSSSSSSFDPSSEDEVDFVSSSTASASASASASKPPPAYASRSPTRSPINSSDDEEDLRRHRLRMERARRAREEASAAAASGTSSSSVSAAAAAASSAPVASNPAAEAVTKGTTSTDTNASHGGKGSAAASAGALDSKKSSSTARTTPASSKAGKPSTPTTSRSSTTKRPLQTPARRSSTGTTNTDKASSYRTPRTGGSGINSADDGNGMSPERWKTQITYAGQVRTIGVFDSKMEASVARRIVGRLLGLASSTAAGSVGKSPNGNGGNGGSGLGVGSTRSSNEEHACIDGEEASAKFAAAKSKALEEVKAFVERQRRRSPSEKAATPTKLALGTKARPGAGRAQKTTSSSSPSVRQSPAVSSAPSSTKRQRGGVNMRAEAARKKATTVAASAPANALDFSSTSSSSDSDLDCKPAAKPLSRAMGKSTNTSIGTGRTNRSSKSNTDISISSISSGTSASMGKSNIRSLARANGSNKGRRSPATSEAAASKSSFSSSWASSAKTTSTSPKKKKRSLQASPFSDDESDDETGGDNKNDSGGNKSPTRYGDEVNSAKNVTWIISTDRSIGARVYAAFPENNMFYWGYVVGHDGPITDEGPARYTVFFEDGDSASDLTRGRICTEIDYVQILKINPPLPNPDKDFRKVLKEKLAKAKAAQAAAAAALAAAGHVNGMRKSPGNATTSLETPVRKGAGKRKLAPNHGRKGGGSSTKKCNISTVPAFFTSASRLNDVEQNVANRVFSMLSSLNIQTLDNADTSDIASAIQHELGVSSEKKSAVMAQEILEKVKAAKKSD